MHNTLKANWLASISRQDLKTPQAGLFQRPLEVCINGVFKLQAKLYGRTVEDRAYEGLRILIDLFLSAVYIKDPVKLEHLPLAAARIEDCKLVVNSNFYAACIGKHCPYIRQEAGMNGAP